MAESIRYKDFVVILGENSLDNSHYISVVGVCSQLIRTTGLFVWIPVVGRSRLHIVCRG